MVSTGAGAKNPRQAQELDSVALWRVVVDSWKKLQREAEKNLVGADLTTAELRILKTLNREGSLPMNRFSHETMLSQPTITGMVDKLEVRELVERVRNPDDRREVLIALTSKGKVELAKGEELHKKFVDRALSVLSDDELDRLASLMKRLADASEPPS